MIQDYKSLPIGMYLNILAVADNEPVEEMRNPQILSMLTGKSVSELEALPIIDFAALMRRASFLTVPPKPQKARKTYVCGPFELRPVLDYKKITTAQYIDFQTFTKTLSQGEPRMVEILSCFLVPVGHKT